MLSNLKSLGNAKILAKADQRRFNGGSSALSCFVFAPGNEECPTGWRPDGTRCCRTDLPHIVFVP
ncbi:MAG: hypothetical protein AAFQ94_19625 [Bacteroidota bacterium]